MDAVGPTTLPIGFGNDYFDPMSMAVKRCLIRREQGAESPDWPYVACRINKDDDTVHSLNGWRAS